MLSIVSEYSHLYTGELRVLSHRICIKQLLYKYRVLTGAEVNTEKWNGKQTTDQQLINRLY